MAYSPNRHRERDVSEISIEWLSDCHQCETCGSSYAEGAVVSIDGAVAIEMRPTAHCFGGKNYDQAEVFERILKHLGHTMPALPES